jgi:hypothetical protein
MRRRGVCSHDRESHTVSLKLDCGETGREPCTLTAYKNGRRLGVIARNLKPGATLTLTAADCEHL